MSGKVTKKEINRLRSKFSSDDKSRIVQNAVTTTTVSEVTLSRDIIANIDNSYSTKIDDWKVTNQKASGRCWLFATLNLMRPGAMEKMGLKDFEFSQAFVHFWDKFERANHNLEAIIATSDRPL
ncbi:MAG TPA: C1 family peptidase, partial [Candidatus Thalassarchaeaceae archaeon]|nr:C1 family peptidase [Candidatus Thalassarchaeaceae archaeon]